jgi:16S rRNA (cytidine1402-2'-O)-methyltransferase
VVCRELTKLYETLYRGPLGVLAADPQARGAEGRDRDPGRARPRGEATAGDIDTALADALTRLRPPTPRAEVAKALGCSRRDVYQRAMACGPAK